MTLVTHAEAAAFSVGAKPRHAIETDLGLTPAGR